MCGFGRVMRAATAIMAVFMRHYFTLRAELQNFFSNLFRRFRRVPFGERGLHFCPDGFVGNQFVQNCHDLFRRGFSLFNGFCRAGFYKRGGVEKLVVVRRRRQRHEQ